jgi:hypothetical protein
MGMVVGCQGFVRPGMIYNDSEAIFEEYDSKGRDREEQGWAADQRAN